MFRPLRQLAASLLAGLVLASLLSPAAAQDESWSYIRAALFEERPIQDGAGIVTLDAPKRAQDAAIVPIRVTAEIPQTSDRFIQAVHLIIDRNPAPVAGVFRFSVDSGSASFATRVRVDQYTNIRAIAEMNDGSLFMAAKFVKSAGGCSAPGLKDAEEAMANIGKMQLKQLENAVLDRPNEAQLLISHPNYSGLQFDQITRFYIPAHFVRDITVQYDGRTIMTVEGNISLSEDPSIHFSFVPHGAGDITVDVTDSDGLKFSQTWPVTPAPGT